MPLLCSQSSMAPTSLGVEAKVLTVTHKSLRNKLSSLSTLAFLPRTYSFYPSFSLLFLFLAQFSLRAFALAVASTSDTLPLISS